MKKRPSCLIVGGAGQMGRLLARFFRRGGFTVLILDPAGTPSGYRKATIEAAADADVVVVAAPLSKTAQAMDAVLATRPRGLVLDIASVKAPLAKPIRRALDAGISIASVHPMFGPSVRSFRGRDLIVCDAGDPAAARRAAGLFAGSGVRIRTMPLAEHDPWVARTMGLAHVVAVSVASTLAAYGLDVFDLEGRASTSFRRLLELVEPLLTQPPELTWAIQRSNPHSRAALARFASELESWRRLAASPEVGPFLRKAERTRRSLIGR